MFADASKAALAAATAALLGRSAYAPPIDAPSSGVNDDDLERMRAVMGGQIQPLAFSQTRWYLSDLERAELDADAGELAPAARLMRAARRDGRFSGVLSTRTGGLVRLPKRFRGDAEVVAALDVGHEDRTVTRSVFDEMFPPAELALLAADGELLGVGVGELVPVQGRDYPVLVRLDPEFLIYRWNENRWYFRSIAGPIPITPGDGRWILHTPGGRMSPWQNGLWRAIGRAYIRKEHAQLHKDNYEAKLANPARVATAPQGAGEEQKQTWFRSVMAWGVNTVFGMTPGYDVKLLESNGRGWEAFDTTLAECNTDMIIAVAGQTVTVDGGAGFQNSDIHKTIRADLIKATADALALTINTQGVPMFVALRFGAAAIESRACVVEWDVTPPKDRNSEATSMVTTATALTQLTSALRDHDKPLDIDGMCERFAVPLGKPKPAAADDTIEGATALNGAQVTSSLLEVIGQVVTGQLPRESALAIIESAFGIDTATAEKILGTVGAGFVPAALPDAAPADADTDADDYDDDAVAEPAVEEYEVAA